MTECHEELCHPRGLLDACLLLLIRERPSHGYDLIGRLRPFGFDGAEPGLVYRALRRLDDCGYVDGHWADPPTGRRRRVYEITPKGAKELALSAQSVKGLGMVLDELITRYVTATSSPPRDPR